MEINKARRFLRRQGFFFWLLLLGLLLVWPLILKGMGFVSESSATPEMKAIEADAGSHELLLPVVLKGGASVADSARLLSSGQTIGYRGVSGVQADGNRDDGDLIRGRLQEYEYESSSEPTSQVENVVIDKNTGLMWIRDVTLLDGADEVGVHANIGLSETYTWQEAIELSQALVYAGYDDWRLPNLKELQTLVHYGRSEPAIDMSAFPTPFERYASPYFWTATTFPAAPRNAFYVNFLNGHTYPFGKGTGFSLRPVRNVAVNDPIALLRTGQTVGYRGNEGQLGEGNGDDGDLQLGLRQNYETQDDGLIDTADENLVVDRNTGLMWVRNPLLLTSSPTLALSPWATARVRPYTLSASPTLPLSPSPTLPLSHSPTGRDADSQLGLQGGVAGNVLLSEPLDWQTSIERVNELVYGGYDDWRMPNLVELESISQAGREDGIFDAGVFTNAPIDGNDAEAFIWWSSTTSAYDRNENEPGKDAAWYVTSAFGSTNFVVYDYRPAKLRPGYVRPVRDVAPEPDSGLFLPEVRSAADFEALTLASSSPNLLREGKFILPALTALTPPAPSPNTRRGGEESPLPPAPSPNTSRGGVRVPPLELGGVRGGRVRGGLPFVAAYQNVNRHPLHYEFLLAAFPGEFAGMTPDEYTALVSRRATRQYLVGGLKSFSNAAGQRVYGFDVYSEPTDDGELLSEEETSALYWRLARTFRRRPLVYSPSRAAAVEMALSWGDPDFPIDFPAPTASPEYEAYTVGQSYGTLRLLTLAELEDAAQEGRLSRQEIVVIDRTPTDLESIVAGIVTGDEQGTLSHLSIRTARRGTPNAYIKDSHMALAPYADQLVRLSLTRTGYYVETGVSQADAEAWWAAQRPPTVTVRAPDVTYSALDDLATIAAGDQQDNEDEDQGGSATTRVGGKAANLARLYRFLPSEHQVAGFGIPFAAYDRFMRENTLLDERVTPPVLRSYADYVALLHQDPAFRTDPERRSDLLDDLRDEMRDNGLVSPQLVAEVAARVDEIFGDGVMVRFRSSSNAEDGLEFNGAGLYDSTSVCVRDSFDSDSSGPSRCDANQSKERTIERGLKKVWASLWNFRAWEERDYYGIDHLDVGMALLITPAFPNERANGVAFTGDPTGAESSEYLVNVQDGDVSVVLPDPGVVPERDQLVVNDGQITGIRRLRPSSLLPSGTWVMSEAELFSLGNVLLLADQQFPLNLGAYAREDVLLDLEFKIQRGDNALLIKQIRPFLKNGPHLPGQSAFLRLHVPQPLAMCGGWREGFDLRREREEKTRLTLPASDIQLPLEAADATHALFGDLAFGPNLEGSSATGEGTVQIEPIGDGSTLRVTLARQYTPTGNSRPAAPTPSPSRPAPTPSPSPNTRGGEKEAPLPSVASSSPNSRGGEHASACPSLPFPNSRGGEHASACPSLPSPSIGGGAGGGGRGGRLRVIEVTLALSNIRAGEFDLRRLDRSTLTSQLLMTGQIRDVESGEILSRLRLVPCDLTSLPLVRFDIQLEGDRHLILQQRREREDGVSGLAALVSAEITMPEGTQSINSYRQLTYAADRHHWNEKFEVRFEPPLADAHGIAIYQHYTGSGEPQYTAELLDQSLNTLRRLTVESVKRGTEGN